MISSFSPIFVTKEDLPSFLEVAVRCLCEKTQRGRKTTALKEHKLLESQVCDQHFEVMVETSSAL